ncbi:MAG: AhpC/TSA family protein [Actinobacteria bacterium]|nr:AhpC/TSA family protein [Actinomycetota bacterium]
MRVREQRDRLEALGASALAVGFSPAPALAELADALQWPWPFLTDPDRLLYARLGLGRARLREVYTPATLRIYREAAGRGDTISRPVEDARQLGGDAIVRHGRAVRVFRPASPDDRPAVDELLAAAATAASDGR